MSTTQTIKKNPALDKARELQSNVLSTGREIWLAGLGVVASAEEGSRDLFDRLIERGTKVEGKSEPLFGGRLGEARERVEELGGRIDERFQDTMSSTLRRFGVPSSRDVQDLIHQVEKLTTQVEALAAQR